ncbi:DUF1294 domain-containing protein [Thiohalomonas denitrificans]|uniref:Cold shock protein, CspA family n=1 Tax=Thiohalomonas denitrificans TaxID=415747 RepID=A0A1G5R1F0_9GAMM|nr:DUF1294 domain-containing protein [Thiohalomonas denitrificans]SCZ67924.1 Cold shock protein, CspA family [Thiohalomonas denitrificans]
MRIKGKIAFWDDEKGYGFIEPYTGRERVFIHIKAFSNAGRRPKINQVVTFALSSDKQGRPCALKASLAGDHLPRKTQRKDSSLSTIGGAVFLVIVGVLVATAKIPHFVLTLYIIASLITFIVYAADKSAAQKGGWRTQESTLHLLSLAGG